MRTGQYKSYGEHKEQWASIELRQGIQVDYAPGQLELLIQIKVGPTLP